MSTNPAFTACLAVNDITETLDFYESLGFGVSRESISSDGVHLVFNGERMAFMVQPKTEANAFLPQVAQDKPGASAFFYLDAPDFDAACAKIRDQVEVLKEAEDGGYRMMYFRDPNGYSVALSANAA
ncbi:VOC family protein [Streptomyces sp. SID13588]|uniref:VOC family protein n=1 Tax=Streptomyces sp. SID13588 TaxID=2706051 RepID=UPI0013CD499E|nr:VOC family protein [Streptomyces sp. SID13588]NEA72592.1 VOC family protein [Streptomyces sp. SID13588]